jgi:Tol biopolymer transport system component
MVAEVNGQNDGRVALLDVATQSVVDFSPKARSIFESWNPDASQYVGVYADSGASNYNLLLFDGDSGALLGDIDVGGTAEHPANHPDWSPDGSRIVYTRMGIKGTNQRMFKGSIEMIEDLGGMWSSPVTLVAPEDGHNHYYPAFSPDGAYVVYDESLCSTGSKGDDCDADTNPTATLFMMRAEEGATPVELAAANAPGIADGDEAALTDSYPKWSPFVFRRDAEFSSDLEWVTFSSTRQFGLREPPGDGTLLWMAGVMPDRVDSGQDPSFPAFAIPSQDFHTSNHIAQWTEAAVIVN